MAVKVKGVRVGEEVAKGQVRRNGLLRTGAQDAARNGLRQEFTVPGCAVR